MRIPFVASACLNGICYVPSELNEFEMYIGHTAPAAIYSSGYHNMRFP